MNVSFTVPEGFHIMGLQSSAPTKDGSTHWLVWVRSNQKNGLGEFFGADGFDLQAAIDEAVANLKTRLAQSRPAVPDKFPGLKLNLKGLNLG